MIKLSAGQLEKLADISGNIAVAWFTMGVISPLFIPPQNIPAFPLSFIAALISAFLFIVLSLDLIKRRELL